jgi:hypothetical protein
MDPNYVRKCYEMSYQEYEARHGRVAVDVHESHGPGKSRKSIVGCGHRNCGVSFKICN